MPKSCATKELSVEEMSALYDRIYDIADRLLKKYNPCKIHYTKTGILCCTEMDYKYGSKRLCCTCCNDNTNKRPIHSYWSKNGCTIKALGCKLFLCHSIRNKNLHKRFQTLRDYASKHLYFIYYDKKWNENTALNIAGRYYMSKEQWLKLLKESRSEKSSKATVKV